MDRVIFEGKEYRRYTEKWVDTNNMTVSEILQDRLNAAFFQTQNLQEMTYDELVEYGNKYKNSGSIGIAIRLFEFASTRADAGNIAGLLPRLTSCYRSQGQPQKAIDLLEYARAKYGERILSGALLTSAAAAYCDLKQYRTARKCCDRAFAMSNGKKSGELSAVYARIRKESNEMDLPK